MEFKGTKGKWEWSVSENSNGFAYINGGDITIYGDETKKAGTISLETQANAKLIAAAPEMFELLKRILNTETVMHEEIEQLLTKITEL